jgi:hypothetical protein
MPAYEIHGIRDDGSTFGIVGAESKKRPEHEADAEAYSIAEHYAKRWTQAAEVRLYKTPHANFTSVSSFDLWPGQVSLITTIHRGPCAPPSLCVDPDDDDVPF